MSIPVRERPRLGWPTKSLYGLGALGPSVKGQLLGLVLLFYNQLMGLPASKVSLVLLVALLVDAFWDPVVGQLSDRTRTPIGRRHPYIYAAALPASICFAAIFMPPAGWSADARLLYLLVAIVGLRLFDSMTDVPGAALLPELSRDYDARSSLSSWRLIFARVVGPALGTFLGFAVFLKGTKAQPYGQLNVGGYAPLAITGAAIAFVVLVVSALATQRFVPFLHYPERRPAGYKVMLREMGVAISDRSFAALLVAFLIFGIASGMAGLNTYFTTYFWELPSRALLQFGLWTIPSSLIGAIVAPRFGRWLGKKHACLTVMYLTILISTLPISLRLLGLMPPNGSPWVLRILIVDAFAQGLLGSIGAVMVVSMIADTVEEVQLKTRQRSEGVLFAAESLVSKITTSFGVAIPGLLLDYVGFPKGAKPGHVDMSVLNHLALIYLPIYTALWLCAGSMIWFYRIDRRRHEDNLSQLRDAGPTAPPTAPAQPALEPEGGLGDPSNAY